jgi:tRNA U34 5-methylaminomethyl-2-thiouridine-forming methyltransferase MnmC
MKPQLIVTQDGSHTVFVPQIDEHYHSVHGAIQESRHVFLQSALSQCRKDVVHVFEVGFGTGLNAFLTLLEAEATSKKIHYTTIELYPLDNENAAQLNYAQQLDNGRLGDFMMLHAADWDKEVIINEHFTLDKRLVDLAKFDYPVSCYDVVYFDAFSPEKQPEMWQEKVFSDLYEACCLDAILTTYCAKGAVRRAMQAAGFVVERIPAPLGKREMLRARKLV